MSYLNFSRLNLALKHSKFIMDIDEVVDIRALRVNSKLHEINKVLDRAIAKTKTYTKYEAIR